MGGQWGDGSLYGPKFIEVQPPVCRKSWCVSPATREDGLCTDHGREQDRIRARAAEEIADGRRYGRHGCIGSRASGEPALTAADHPLDPERCVITPHALGRYAERRRTGDPEAGVRKLLRRIVDVGDVHLALERHGHPPRVLYRVGEFKLIFSDDHRALITIVRSPKKPIGRREGGKRNRRRIA